MVSSNNWHSVCFIFKVIKDEKNRQIERLFILVYILLKRY